VKAVLESAPARIQLVKPSGLNWSAVQHAFGHSARSRAACCSRLHGEEGRHGPPSTRGLAQQRFEQYETDQHKLWESTLFS
jgi:hypothetical protein